MADFDNTDIMRLGLAQIYDDKVLVVNTVHLRCTLAVGLTAAQMAVAAAAWVDGYLGLLAIYYPDTLLPDAISMANVTQGTVFGDVAYGTYAGGVSVADVLPTQVALLGWLRTTVSRRQARQYFGPFTEVSMADSEWSAALQTAALNAMIYLLNGQVIDPNVSLQGGVYTRTLGLFTLGVSADVSNIPVVQRRRRIGRGA